MKVRAPTDPRQSLILAAAAVMAVVGMTGLHATPIGASLAGAARGIGSQIGTTLPAAALVAAVVVLQVASGAVLMRAALGRPFTARADAALFGLVGAVLLGVAQLLFLGGTGSFVGPVLWVLVAGTAIYGSRRGRVLVARDQPSRRLPAGFWLLLAVSWSGPVLLQLASPVVPFRDVLHNHVAPVEFARTYHWFPDLFTSPAAETGPSRQVLGYLGFAATATKMSGLPAVLAVAALALPMCVLLGLATYRFAEARLGPGCGMWAVCVMPLSFVFLRLPDSRATDLVVILALASFLPLPGLDARRLLLVRSLCLAAAIYVHPLMGALTLAAHGLLALSFAVRRSLEEDDFPVGALPTALAFAFPELLVAAGRDAPSWIVVLAVPAGLVAASLCSRLRLPLRRIGIALLALGTIAALLAATTVGPRIVSAIADEVNLYPLVTAGSVAILLVSRERRLRPYIVVPVAVGVLAHVAAQLLPSTTVFWSGTRDEITGKTMQYWVPTFLASGTAGALRWAWGSARRSAGTAAVAAFLVASVLPLRAGTIDIEDNHERRVAETLSIDMHKAEVGAWPNWPDARRVIDGSQQALVDVFRAEQRAGRMTRRTKTLHIAQSRWTWVSTPTAAFAGVDESNFSEAPDITGHTLGGRLHTYQDLAAYLGPRNPYVLLEPAGVPAFLRDEVVAAGYRAIFVNARGEIFRYPG